MRTNAAKTLLVALPSLLLGSLLTATLTTTARANPPASDQWVYQVGVYATSSDADRERVMSTWGNSGFEAYAVTTLENKVTVVYFKKRR